MANANSFTETVNDLVKQVNIGLESLVSLNNSLTTQEDTVNITIEETNDITGDPSLVTYSIPAYNTTINKVNAVYQTVDTFVKGLGKVLLKDGTYREVKVNPIPSAPPQITNVTAPSRFSVKNNWFFESMMFPQLTVSFDLKNKIDDKDDRIKVKRIIFDNSNDEETQWFLDNFSGKELTYWDCITILGENNKQYWEDDETHFLPLLTNPYTGSFLIVDKTQIDEDGLEWYVLNTLNYGVSSDEPVIKNIQLNIGDQLRYNNSIYKIEKISIEDEAIRIILMSGLDHPTINGQFKIYTPPFSSKIATIPVGYNECNIMFLKGINDDYNILGDNWSNSISFWTNNLILNENVTPLDQYYNTYVSDYGKQLEGQIKEKYIPTYYGVLPDSPSFTADQFSVSQINTQLNAALDVNAVKTTRTQIESSKSIINSLKTTIAQQKSELVETTNIALRTDLQSKIDDNISILSKTTVKYQSLVKSLATVAYENSAVLVNPKYRVRGFFDIPIGKPINTDPTAQIQEIIQFDIAYRYLRLDTTGNPLNTYNYIDPSTGQTIQGVFTDWIVVPSPIKIKQYNADIGSYYWVEESISNGDINNINQVDIPIKKGELVQLKIRSISEAGWPNNPLKSDWSDPVIIEFPTNLEGSDQVINILLDAQAEETAIKLSETLSASGVITHMDDSIPNPNSGSGTYFKHQSEYLAYDLSKKDADGVITSTSTQDLQAQLSNLPSNSYITVVRNPDSILASYQNLTGTLQQFFQAIVNADPSVYQEFETLVT